MSDQVLHPLLLVVRLRIQIAVEFTQNLKNLIKLYQKKSKNRQKKNFFWFKNEAISAIEFKKPLHSYTPEGTYYTPKNPNKLKKINF